MRIVLALCLILSSAALATPAQAADCDRECLRGKVTEVLHAFAGHDVGKLAVAGNLRVTEDGVEKPLAQVGLVRTVTKLRGYRQDVIDERAGVSTVGTGPGGAFDAGARLDVSRQSAQAGIDARSEAQPG